jgi:hypothetical protein
MRSNWDAQGYRTGDSVEEGIVACGIIPNLETASGEPSRGGCVPGACATATRSDAICVPLQGGRDGAATQWQCRSDTRRSSE